MPRLLQTLLRLALALALGLGPLGASVVAASLHAPLCACCTGEVDAEAGCCGSEGGAEGVLLVASTPDCACTIAAPEHGPAPVLAQRPGELRDGPRGELERGQRVVAFAWRPMTLGTTAASLGVPRDPLRRAGCTGPAGKHGLRGGARAAALGTLRI